ncbi:hypothetical protein [Mycoplasma buteonis]|uniref:hypothetical protein n=1 Tax=Mycoplasma buteonis TaxID=171280 RepID=UPI00055FF614|nr:hypothetical protein [Mycoplasma buteonis]
MELENKTSWKLIINILFWQKKINGILKVFSDINLLSLTNVTSMKFTKIKKNGKWATLEDFIEDFIKNLPYEENLSHLHKVMLQNFFHYALYQLAYKSYLKKIKLTFIETSSYNKENAIELNHNKRDFYYDFLDEFKKIPNYNSTLIQLLKILL